MSFEKKEVNIDKALELGGRFSDLVEECERSGVRLVDAVNMMSVNHRGSLESAIRRAKEIAKEKDNTHDL